MLANGIEAIFSFSIQLLRKNEDVLLKMKFDEILAFLNGKLLDAYKVPYLRSRLSSTSLTRRPLSSPPTAMTKSPYTTPMRLYKNPSPYQ